MGGVRASHTTPMSLRMSPRFFLVVLNRVDYRHLFKLRIPLWEECIVPAREGRNLGTLFSIGSDLLRYLLPNNARLSLWCRKLVMRFTHIISWDAVQNILASNLLKLRIDHFAIIKASLTQIERFHEARCKDACHYVITGKVWTKSEPDTYEKLGFYFLASKAHWFGVRYRNFYRKL